MSSDGKMTMMMTRMVPAVLLAGVRQKGFSTFVSHLHDGKLRIYKVIKYKVYEGQRVKYDIQFIFDLITYLKVTQEQLTLLSVKVDFLS